MHPQIAQDFDLTGRVAVVTGAGSGIGRGTAQLLAQAGARLVLCDVNFEGLIETRDLITADGGVAVEHPVDVTQRAALDTLGADTVAKFGRLDIWVNSAGTIVNVPIVDSAEEQIDKVIAVNLKGVYGGCAVAGRIMQKAGRGSIINLSSSGGETAVPGLALYSLTKAAVNMLTRTAAKELGPFGIRVNAVAPGWVDTPMGTHRFRNESGEIDQDRLAEGLRQREAASPLGITGTPRDIALAILYLASDASRFMTGQILRPNGGVSMP